MPFDPLDLFPPVVYIPAPLPVPIPETTVVVEAPKREQDDDE